MLGTGRVRVEAEGLADAGAVVEVVPAFVEGVGDEEQLEARQVPLAFGLLRGRSPREEKDRLLQDIGAVAAGAMHRAGREGARALSLGPSLIADR